MKLRIATGLILAVSLVSLAPAKAGENQAAITAAQVEKLMKTAPDAFNTHLTAAKFYEQQGSIGQAEDEYRRATTCKGASTEAFKHLAQLLLKSADYAEAESTARSGLKLFPRTTACF